MTSQQRAAPAEWDAAVYHRVATPHIAWGTRVLDRLSLAGNETVVDAGCGTGHITTALLERLPAGRVIAIDRSANMLAQAAAHLVPRFGDRITLVQGDIAHLDRDEPVDAVFSTATFHWVRDHPGLFRGLFAALRPGGQLVAQCGGGPNIASLRERAATLLHSPRFREQAAGWSDPWEFASPEESADRLRDAGFVDISTWLEPAPVTFGSEAEYREFVRSVVLLEHLRVLADDATREAFLSEITARAAADDPPFLIDYWRLNLQATRPVDRRAEVVSSRQRRDLGVGLAGPADEISRGGSE